MSYSYLNTIPPERGNMIRALQRVQEHEGYVPDDAIEAVALHCGTEAVEVEGVLSFYAQFKRTKPGKYVINICDGTACHIKGANLITGWLRDELGIASGETTPDGLFSVETVACLGCCSLAPVIAVNSEVHGNLDRKKLLKVVKSYRKLEASS